MHGGVPAWPSCSRRLCSKLFSAPVVLSSIHLRSHLFFSLIFFWSCTCSRRQLSMGMHLVSLRRQQSPQNLAQLTGRQQGGSLPANLHQSVPHHYLQAPGCLLWASWVIFFGRSACWRPSYLTPGVCSRNKWRRKCFRPFTKQTGMQHNDRVIDCFLPSFFIPVSWRSFCTRSTPKSSQLCFSVWIQCCVLASVSKKIHIAFCIVAFVCCERTCMHWFLWSRKIRTFALCFCGIFMLWTYMYALVSLVLTWQS